MAAYSLDLRQRVIAELDGGSPSKAVAEKYSVSVAWVNRLRQRYAETGSLEPKAMGRPQGSKLDAHQDRLAELIEEKPDRTLMELRELLDIEVSRNVVWIAVKKLGYRFKKNH